MASPMEADDDGLAPERTVMAWNRSGIAFLVAIAALGRRLWPLDRGNHGVVLITLGIAAMAFLSGLWFASRLRTRARYAGETLDAGAFKLMSSATFVLAIAGFGLALFPT